MESPAPAAGPRVYVPISHPDSPVPTYAVLQFLGISPPPDPSSPAPPPLLHPPLHLLPCSSPASTPPSPIPKRCASSAESSTSSSSDEKDKKLTSIKPSPMKKSASAGGLSSSCLSPVSRRNGKALPLGPTISITHTDKDTIIHTHSSNFREVVHQLTGATSGDKGLMPVTLPARNIASSNRSGVGNDKDFTAPAAAVPLAASPRTMIQSGGDRIEAAIVRKPLCNPTTKLLERRKSNKVLERLSTSCRNLPPLVPSPVTPLASDFEKISLPVTPTTSEGSLTPVVVNLSALSHDARAMDTLSLAGAMALHEGKPIFSRSQSARVMSMDVNGDAMDVQGPQTPQLPCSQSLSLHDGKDVQSPVLGMQSSILHSVMDATGPSLALATGVVDVSLPEEMDVQNDQELNAHTDAMDADSLCDGAGVPDSSSTGTDSGIVNDEESIIAKKGFFFHSQRPRHGDATLLALFPESPREM
ncbi:hypothetical protein GOP47_0019297 [Adiantum capillus-veneris]|uniref:VQ domain-containing protein n=1 Tax=Adiantum capillus-veneris TaxID=13818 RepID=A0A9D4UEU4_ADICA|nr:hypothetical protein GOP47_0019297 [Adiantum capillus-veneris]